MVKINRSPLPQGVAITKADDYRNAPVFPLLIHDFNNKCYICEDFGEKRWEVDHLQSKTHFPEKQFDWNNLFLSCAYCNSNIKKTNYDMIIDCTLIDPENFISLSISAEDKKVTVEKHGDTVGLEKTVELLEKAYNGTGVCMTDFGSVNLRSKVIRELSVFTNLLDEYVMEIDDKAKEVYGEKIHNAIQRSTPFAAFKRRIIRNNPALLSEFGAAL